MSFVLLALNTDSKQVPTYQTAKYNSYHMFIPNRYIQFYLNYTLLYYVGF